MQKNEIIFENIIGSRTFSNLILFIILFLTGISFFLVGLSSYFQKEFFPFTNTSKINFFPQGILLIFYGTLGCFLGFYILLNFFWDVGSGYNEFSKKDYVVRIVRKGFPGKNNIIFLTYPIDIIKKIKVSFKQGLNPRNNIILVLRDKREIPLYPSNNLKKISEVEKNAIKLSEFLNVPLENESLNF